MITTEARVAEAPKKEAAGSGHGGHDHGGGMGGMDSDPAPAELRLPYLDRELPSGNENALQIVLSPNGSAPFTPLPSEVNPLDNTIAANITQAGFFFLGQLELPPLIFADGFE
jgi:hypothetical protein